MEVHHRFKRPSIGTEAIENKQLLLVGCSPRHNQNYQELFGQAFEAPLRSSM